MPSPIPLAAAQDIAWEHLVWAAERRIPLADTLAAFGLEDWPAAWGEPALTFVRDRLALAWLRAMDTEPTRTRDAVRIGEAA